VFCEAGLNSTNPRDVLVSEATTGNNVLYGLKCSVEWIHESLSHEDDAE
jgi:hypothetical protein